MCLWKKGLRFPPTGGGEKGASWLSQTKNGHLFVCVFFFPEKKVVLFISWQDRVDNLPACFLDQSALPPCYQFSVIKSIRWTYCMKLFPFILKQLLSPLSFPTSTASKLVHFFFSFCLSFITENVQHIQNEK